MPLPQLAQRALNDIQQRFRFLQRGSNARAKFFGAYQIDSIVDAIIENAQFIPIYLDKKLVPLFSIFMSRTLLGIEILLTCFKYRATVWISRIDNHHEFSCRIVEPDPATHKITHLAIGTADHLPHNIRKLHPA